MATDEPDHLAAALRGFGPLGILAILVILAGNFVLPPLGAILVLVWVRWSETPWSEIGYVRPRSWMGAISIGIVFGVAFKLVMKTVATGCFGLIELRRDDERLVLGDPVDHIVRR